MIPTFDKHYSQQGLSFYRAGSGQSLILVHGVGLCAESWYQQVEALVEHYEVFAVDLPEHGASGDLEASFEDAQLDHFVAALTDFIQQYCQHEVVLCGHSLGALVCTELSARLASQVSGLLALNTVYQRSQQARQAVLARAFSLAKSEEVVGVEETLRRWFVYSEEQSEPSYKALCELWLKNNSVSGYAKAYKAFADSFGVNESTLDKVVCPAIFMTGQDDPNSTPAMSEGIADYLNAARGDTSVKAKAIVVPEAAHMMPLTHPQGVCDQLISLKA